MTACYNSIRKKRRVVDKEIDRFCVILLSVTEFVIKIAKVSAKYYYFFSSKYFFNLRLNRSRYVRVSVELDNVFDLNILVDIYFSWHSRNHLWLIWKCRIFKQDSGMYNSLPSVFSTLLRSLLRIVFLRATIFSASLVTIVLPGIYASTLASCRLQFQFQIKISR